MIHETVFARLCDAVDDLQRLASQVEPLAMQYAILHIVDRLDCCIDDVVGLEVPALENDHA